MITAYAFVQPNESPADAKTTLEGILVDAEILGGAEVNLLRVDVTGYLFSIGASDEGSNLTILQSLCGVLNTVAQQSAPMGLARGLAQGWQVAAGGEGRFAAEHPPPQRQ